MAHIQMTDRNPSDLGLMEELTDEELLAVNGGGFWDSLKDTVKDAVGIVKDVKDVVEEVQDIWTLIK